jgi:hypothetical protein
MAKNIYEYLYNDFTNVYRLEGNQQRTVYSNEIQQAIKEKTKGVYFFFHPCLSFGDYDNSCDVERSNLCVFLKEHKKNMHIRHIKGDYGYEAIAIDIMCNSQPIIELLEGLDNYPALCDQDVSRMNIEMEDEAWKCSIKDDFLRAIKKEFGIDYSDVDNEVLWELYKTLKEKSNTDAEVQAGGNVYVNIKRLMEHFEAIPEVA